MTTIHNPLVPESTPRPQARAVLCPHCGSKDHLNLETIESIEPQPGELMVAVSYTCLACEASDAHTAAFHDVAAVLNRDGTTSTLLQFGGQYLHCGELMQLATTSGRSVYDPISTEDPDDQLLDVYLNTRVLKCRCGFRVELPA